MNKADKDVPGSFLALTVGIFIGAMLVLPMFAYMCRVNWQLRQENQRLRVQVVRQASHKPLRQLFISCPIDGAVTEETFRRYGR